MAPPIRPPWDGPTAHALLDARAPNTPPSDRRKAWLELLAAAMTERPRIADAAAALGVPPRTLEQWLSRLRAEHPTLAAGLPVPPRGGARPGAGRPAKPAKK